MSRDIQTSLMSIIKQDTKKSFREEFVVMIWDLGISVSPLQLSDITRKVDISLVLAHFYSDSRYSLPSVHIKYVVFLLSKKD